MRSSRGVNAVTSKLNEANTCSKRKRIICCIWAVLYFSQLSNFHILQICGELGVPIAALGPATFLVFLGIEIDTVVGELHLPNDKLARLQSLLAAWGDKKCCTRRELESLVGLLNHACKVVRAGHSFLRRMIDTHARPHATRATCSSLIRLNKDFRADLAWWQCFVKSWNGIYLAFVRVYYMHITVYVSVCYYMTEAPRVMHFSAFINCVLL